MKSREKQPEKWADEVLSSIEGIKKAQAHPETYNRVMRDIAQGRRPVQQTVLARPAVRPRVQLGFAFALVLLAAMNVFTIVSYHNAAQAQSSSLAQSAAQTKVTAPSSAFAEEYFSYLNNL